MDNTASFSATQDFQYSANTAGTFGNFGFKSTNVECPVVCKAADKDGNLLPTTGASASLLSFDKASGRASFKADTWSGL